MLKFKTVICTIVYSRTWYIWWKKLFCQFPYLESLPSSIVISLCLLMLCMPPEGAFCSCTPSYCSCCRIFWQVFCKSYWNSELIFKGPNLRSLFLSKYAMNFINIYMSNYPNISGYMSPPISSYTLPPFSKTSLPNQISMKVCDICTSIKNGIFKAFKIVAR